jgi:hypothetical protein
VRDFHLADPRGSRLIELKHSLLSQSCAAVCVGTSAMVLTLQGPPLGTVVRCWFGGTLRRGVSLMQREKARGNNDRCVVAGGRPCAKSNGFEQPAGAGRRRHGYRSERQHL